MRKILTILFLSIILISNAQERTVFYGVISDDLEILPNVHITNTTTQKVTFSLNKGNFEIYAKTGDELKFTFVGYKTKTMKVKQQHFGIQTNKIHLNKDVVQLDEVEVKRHNLSGVLESDSKKVITPKKIDAVTLSLPNAGAKVMTYEERKLHTARGGGTMIGFLIGSLNGDIKKAKKMMEISKNEKEVSMLSRRFESYVINDLGISKDDFSRFMYFCQEDEDYKKNKENDADLILFIEEKAQEFKKLQE